MPTRFPAMILVFAGLIAVLVARLFQLQVLQGEEHVVDVEQSRIVTELLPAMRGRILDRNGQAIADNRAAYHLGVRLADLELDWKRRRATTFLRLDEDRFDALIADLSLRLPDDRGDTRSIVLDELMGNLGVAVRARARPGAHEAPLALLAIPRAALAADADDEDVAEAGVGGDQRSGIAVLAEDNLAVEDPRDALVEEARLRGRGAIACLTTAELDKLAERLDGAFRVEAGRSRKVLRAFARQVAVRWPGADPLSDPDESLTWWLIPNDRRAAAVAALARFVRREPAQVARVLDEGVGAVRQQPPTTPFYWAPSARAEEIVALLPRDRGFTELALAGLPSTHERIFVIQEDAAGQPGLFARLQNRLADSLGAPGDWVGALIARHAEHIRARTSERDFRLHQLALDPEKVERLCVGLSAALTERQLPRSSLDIERALSAARRVADKEWAGQGRHDAIAIVRDVPHAVAVELSVASAETPADLAKRFEGTDAALPGLAVIVAAGREYPFPGSASHLIGTLKPLSSDPDFERMKDQEPDPSRLKGSTGLEKTYDAVLSGIAGKRESLRTSQGTTLLREVPPVMGRDLVTEVDMEVQGVAEDALAHWYDLCKAMKIDVPDMGPAQPHGAGRAGMALIDCHTGAIIALASSPGYRIDELRTRWAELADPDRSPGEPLHDHAAESAEPPGSAAKIMTALAALQFKVMTPGEEIYSPGYMQKKANGDKVLKDHAPPGIYDLKKAIQYSSNVYFATLGARLGGERLTEYMHRFGMGQKNALDVEEQRVGIGMPMPGSLAHARPREPTWMTSDSWRAAIGQFMAASPLQCVAIPAAVANGGHIVRPYLVAPQDGPPVVGDLDIRRDYLQTVREGMEAVTDNREGSTAKYLQLEGAGAGIKVAAKTGTSEWGTPASRAAGKNPNHAWLIGYAPAEAPVVAFAIFIHSGCSGGRACSPVAKKVLEAYFAKYGRKGHESRAAPTPH